MEEKITKSIHLLIENPSEEIVSFSEKLGESAPVLCDDVKKIKDEDKVLLLSSNNEIIWNENLIGTVHPSHINHPALEYLIKRSINGEFSVDLAESYEEFDKEVYSYRFIDPFEEGEIADMMAQKILDSGFDPLPFRSYFTALMGYLAHHAKRENIALPIDIQLGIFQGCIVVQVMVGNNSFSVEQIKESFGPTDVSNIYSSLLETAFRSTHILEINRIDNASKLMFTGIWCHDQYKLPGGSLLYQNVDTLKKYVAKKANLALIPNKHQSKFSELKLSGQTARRYGEEETILTNDPSLLKRVIDHASKKIQDGADTPSEIGTLKELVIDFEDQAALTEISSDEFNNVLRALNDVSTKELFDASYEYAMDNLEDEDLFEHLIETANEIEQEESELVDGDIEDDEFSQIVSGSEEDDDFKQVVSGSEEEDDFETRIKGSTQHIKEESTVIKGKKEVADKSKMVIKGGGEDPLKNKGIFNNRISESSPQKTEQLRRASQKLHQLKNENLPVEEIEVAMLEHIIDEVGGSRSAAAEMLKEVVLFSKNESLNKKLKESSLVVKDRLQQERFAQELAKRDNQIERMKAVVQKLQEHASKTAVGKKNVARSIDDDIGESDAPDVDTPQNVQSLDQDINIQLKILKVEASQKDAMIRNLENKLEHFKERSGNTQEQANELKILQKQNAALQSQIDLQAARSENLSERMTQQKEDMAHRDTSELTKFRERIATVETDKQQLKDQLTRLDFSHRELSKKLQEKENEILRLRQSETENNANTDDKGKLDLEKQLEELKLKERSAQHEVKAQALKVRQMEQKLKFSQAQIDKQSSRAGAAASANSGSTNNEKRLEKINQKLAESMKAQSLEIADKKKEAIKLKAENNQLLHKITELERQLSKVAKAS